MTCPISSEPTDQLCMLKCQHVLSLNNLKKLKQKKCPKCRENFDDNDIRYLLQNSIYKNLYSKFFEAGYILPSIELEDSDQITNNKYDNDSDDTEVDRILTKKKKIMKAIKLNSNMLLSSIFPKVSKKQHPTYQNVLKELNGKNYSKAEYWCKEFLKSFPKSYTIRCVLAYIYRCLNHYEKAHLWLDEAIKLKEKTPIAYFIRGEIFFRQNEYEKVLDNLNKSLDYKAKINNLYVILGNSYLFTKRYESALLHYNIALKNDPKYYSCLKNCAYSYEKQEDYSRALLMLDKLLSINNKDSLILGYYGEMLCNIGIYKNAVSYFSKGNDIDPENIHILIKRAVAYYVLQEYDEALSDLDKVIQLDPLNNLAYYYQSLTYYTKKDIDNAMVAFNKCTELLDSDDILAKVQLYHLQHLLNKNDPNDLSHDIIDQISDINDDKLLLFIRCKIYIELKKYHEAKLDFDRLCELNQYKDFSFVYLLQEYSDFWSYLCNICNIKDDFTEIGIITEFNKYMFKERKIYFISHLINLNSKFYQLQENDSNSLSGRVLSLKEKVLDLNFPIFNNIFEFTSFGTNYYVIWKMNIRKIISTDCYIKFLIVQGEKYSNEINSREHILRYRDILKLEKLGWIEYMLPIYVWKSQCQLSIEVNGSIDMQIDYVRFSQINIGNKPIFIPYTGYLLPNHQKICPTIPETSKDKYFSRKEMENLLELKDII
ncbi:hypothetical protein C1645_761016 [Glomus cerebriforme]|uniref:Uncharacterized protein n=1 Tax=Glomus cerebriforme TaxID=658196 RepID=A0A397T770_9GLOM|nr:hypothetical protein C1645_761016 [Glomus cerebriforme]